jgi:murein L,D-transpeptidase YcbB/YkuD
MILRVVRLGAIALLLCAGLLWQTREARAQEPAQLSATANAAMQRMFNNLSAALAAPNEAAAKTNTRAAVGAGEEAVAALNTLRNVATDDVVRSRAKASMDQTQSAVNKARAALNETGDAFQSGVEAARAEVEEAIEEFAPVLERVGPAPEPEQPRGLPRAGEDDRKPVSLAAIGMAGLSLLAAGAVLRRRGASLA